jgi:gentisate 1,2-dioxygenase
MVLGGEGTVELGERKMSVEQQDVWTKPSMDLETLRNNGSVPFRYLKYSNAALLESISAYYEDFGNTGNIENDPGSSSRRRAKDLAPAIPLGSDGGQLLPYEHIIDPDPNIDNPLLFRWAEVSQHLSGVLGLKTGYTGRPLLCLYNPSTGRLNGTTPSFFATITAVGGEFIGGTHRHMSSAINYHFAGRGYSIVEGQRFDWAAGDLMLSAPGWAAHGHTIGGEGARILTVQDHPLHISTGSLVWQEDIGEGEVLALGTQAGFETNLADVNAARTS